MSTQVYCSWSTLPRHPPAMILRPTHRWRGWNLDAQQICARCYVRYFQTGGRHNAVGKSPARLPQGRQSPSWNRLSRTISSQEYFLANGFDFKDIERSKISRLGNDTADTEPILDKSDQVDLKDTSTSSYKQPPQELPHRRRRRLKEQKIASISEIGRGSAQNVVADPVIPPDASSRLTTLSSSLPAQSLRRLFTTYLSLSKPRLTFLIVLTTTTAYSLYPVPAVLLPSATEAPSLSTLTLLFLTTGTALSSASANALNMLFEPSHDAKMTRTRNRPIVRGLIGKKGALLFALITGTLGVGGLYYGTNPTVAGLGLANIILYAGVYTPMKRVSVLNTWAGALVGGIPPLMGWAAAAGQSATHGGDWKDVLLGEGSAGGWLLAGLLFAWQFPHFNALSYTIRDEYRHAGYRMLAWVNPAMNGRVAFRYSILFFPICGALYYVGVTDKGFLVTSSVANTWMAREAWRFWRLTGSGGSARGLFWASVWHLPVVMVLAMVHKKGLWERIWRSAVGDADEADGFEEIDEEHDADEVVTANAVAKL